MTLVMSSGYDDFAFGAKKGRGTVYHSEQLTADFQPNIQGAARKGKGNGITPTPEHIDGTFLPAPEHSAVPKKGRASGKVALPTSLGEGLLPTSEVEVKPAKRVADPHENVDHFTGFVVEDLGHHRARRQIKGGSETHLDAGMLPTSEREQKPLARPVPNNIGFDHLQHGMSVDEPVKQARKKHTEANVKNVDHFGGGHVVDEDYTKAHGKDRQAAKLVDNLTVSGGMLPENDGTHFRGGKVHAAEALGGGLVPNGEDEGKKSGKGAKGTLPSHMENGFMPNEDERVPKWMQAALKTRGQDVHDYFQSDYSGPGADTWKTAYQAANSGEATGKGKGPNGKHQSEAKKKFLAGSGAVFQDNGSLIMHSSNSWTQHRGRIYTNDNVNLRHHQQGATIASLFGGL